MRRSPRSSSPNDPVHQPVLLQEACEWLALRPGMVVLDATIGLGGHAEAILEAIAPSGSLIGLDRDEEAIRRARQRLERFGGRMRLIHGHFGELAARLRREGIGGVDAALFDLGVSSGQLDAGERGFSFSREGPLDMRMDRSEERSAADLVNRLREEEIVRILREYGQERWAGRIARAVVRARPLATTTHLAETVRRAVPPAARHGRIDAATRTFQAIRIAVNRELELLPAGLTQAVDCLKPEGRIVVLAYHSLEDRIVKQTFREEARRGRLEVLTRKPLRPSPEEVAGNPRSRSAILRAAQRTGEGS